MNRVITLNPKSRNTPNRFELFVCNIGFTSISNFKQFLYNEKNYFLDMSVNYDQKISRSRVI